MSLNRKMLPSSLLLLFSFWLKIVKRNLNPRRQKDIFFFSPPPPKKNCLIVMVLLLKRINQGILPFSKAAAATAQRCRKRQETQWAEVRLPSAKFSFQNFFVNTFFGSWLRWEKKLKTSFQDSSSSDKNLFLLHS